MIGRTTAKEEVILQLRSRFINIQGFVRSEKHFKINLSIQKP